MAIEFVLTYLANPAGVRSSGWEQPNWANFTWFTEIRSSRIDAVRVKPDRGNGRMEVVTRSVSFWLGLDQVAILNLEGERRPGSQRACWAISNVRYRLEWPATAIEPGKWIDKPLLAATLTGYPKALAPHA